MSTHSRWISILKSHSVLLGINDPSQLITNLISLCAFRTEDSCCSAIQHSTECSPTLPFSIPRLARQPTSLNPVASIRHRILAEAVLRLLPNEKWLAEVRSSAFLSDWFGREVSVTPRDSNRNCFGNRQSALPLEHRKSIVKWIAEACQANGWSSSTFALTVTIFDKYVVAAPHVISNNDLGPLATASLYMAASLAESSIDHNIPKIEKFRKLCPEVGSLNSIREAQAHIIDVLQGRLPGCRSTPFDIATTLIGELLLSLSCQEEDEFKYRSDEPIEMQNFKAQFAVFLLGASYSFTNLDPKYAHHCFDVSGLQNAPPAKLGRIEFYRARGGVSLLPVIFDTLMSLGDISTGSGLCLILPHLFLMSAAFIVCVEVLGTVFQCLFYSCNPSSLLRVLMNGSDFPYHSLSQKDCWMALQWRNLWLKVQCTHEVSCFPGGYRTLSLLSKQISKLVLLVLDFHVRQYLQECSTKEIPDHMQAYSRKFDARWKIQSVMDELSLCRFDSAMIEILDTKQMNELKNEVRDGLLKLTRIGLLDHVSEAGNPVLSVDEEEFILRSGINLPPELLFETPKHVVSDSHGFEWLNPDFFSLSSVSSSPVNHHKAGTPSPHTFLYPLFTPPTAATSEQQQHNNYTERNRPQHLSGVSEWMKHQNTIRTSSLPVFEQRKSNVQLKPPAGKQQHQRDSAKSQSKKLDRNLFERASFVHRTYEQPGLRDRGRDGQQLLNSDDILSIVAEIRETTERVRATLKDAIHRQVEFDVCSRPDEFEPVEIEKLVEDWCSGRSDRRHVNLQGDEVTKTSKEMFHPKDDWPENSSSAGSESSTRRRRSAP